MESDSNPSNALVRKRDDLELMPPPPPPKRIKRPKKVISEDSYTDALSRIIARDFFPGLLESETQQEYLDALDSKDPEWIRNASRRLQHVMTPGRKRARRGTSLAPGSQTPRNFAGDTPVSVSAESAAPSSRNDDDDDDDDDDNDQPEIDTNVSLSAFQAKYTSEDNESFYKLLDKQNSKRAGRYAWLWAGNRLPSRMRLAQARVEARRLLGSGRASLDDDDGFEEHVLAGKDRDGRPGRPDTWESRPDNALMFAPGGIEDGMETRAQVAEAASRAPPRAVSYQNTRLPPAPRPGGPESVPPSPSLSAVRDAIAGRRRPGGEATSTVAGGGETPRVNGYAFVDDEDDGPEHGAPRMLPRIDLGPGDATPNPFVIKAQSRREALHHSMVDRISESRRASARLGVTGKVEKTPVVPRFPSSPRVTIGGGGGGGGDGLTPAAQRLWNKIGTSASVTPRTPFGQSTPMRSGRGSKLKQVSK
ncbi:putative nuclear protein Es2 [Rosellinia necatrix]|uniref:Putative nuclear protein Es2 n=1 Tax=Rosellinia necatrix TaxID=77044 RepID=A0A1W2THM3_ROSNE|nr:putative nuclear protein Es2 [Rosellinia necatrix]